MGRSEIRSSGMERRSCGHGCRSKAVPLESPRATHAAEEAPQHLFFLSHPPPFTALQLAGQIFTPLRGPLPPALSTSEIQSQQPRVGASSAVDTDEGTALRLGSQIICAESTGGNPPNYYDQRKLLRKTKTLTTIGFQVSIFRANNPSDVYSQVFVYYTGILLTWNRKLKGN